MDTLVFSKDKDGWSYDREKSPITTKISNKLLKEHGLKAGYGCEIVPSGTLALTYAIETLVLGIKAPDWPSKTPTLQEKITTIICASELYTGTERYLNYLKIFRKINIINFDVDVPGSLTRCLGYISSEMSVLVLAETCSNPHGKMFPFQEFTELKSKYRLILLLDNTWLSHVIFNPFKHDAELVISSMTKYYSGGRVMGGFIIGKNDYLTNIKYYSKVKGNHVSPYDAGLLLEMLSSLYERVVDASKNTLKLIGTLHANFEIGHPCLEYKLDYFEHLDLKDFDINKIIFPSVFIIFVSGKKDSIIERIKTFKFLEYKTSYGGPKSRIDQYPKQVKDKVMLRISVGYEEKDEDLVNIVSEIKTLL